MLSSLILGDCLQTLQNLPSESVDLCYIDPPFFSNRNYEVIWGDKGEVRSFEDRWSGGVDHYIGWLKERVQEIHRILKPTGSFYLHCDWHADAYIRVYILDKVFGEGNFLNEITWKRTGSHNASKKYGPISDKIFLYSKFSQYTFNDIKIGYDEKYLKTFNLKDKNGYYKGNALTGSNLRNGFSGKEWKGYDPNKKNRHWAIPRSLREEFNIPKDQNVLEVLDYLDKNDLIIHPENKNSLPSYKQYLHLSKGRSLVDIFDDIPRLQGTEKEAIGYPTQKPEALLERIIKASSNEGDVVLDCFVGGGTTVAVADRLGRKWIGIDQSVQAIKVSEFRLNRQKNLFSEPFEVRLHKYDYDTLRYKDAFEFETWIVEKFGGQGNIKQRGDLGLDGKDKNGKPIQVKRSDGIGRNVIDNFVSASKRYDKNIFEKAIESGEIIGTIIAFSFGKGAIQEAARLKNEDKILIDLIKVDEIIAIAKKPNVKLVVELLEKKEKTESYKFEIKATAEEGSQIEFYSFEIWQEKNPPRPADTSQEGNFGKTGNWEQILSDSLNKNGQIEQELKPGKYKIIGKAIDNDGLEGEDEVEVVVGLQY